MDWAACHFNASMVFVNGNDPGETAFSANAAADRRPVTPALGPASLLSRAISRMKWSVTALLLDGWPICFSGIGIGLVGAVPAIVTGRASASGGLEHA